MGYLTKDQILAVDDLPIQDVEVPEWGGVIRLRGLTALEMDRWEMRISRAKQNGITDVDFRASCVGQCIVDESGNRLFTTQDIVELSKKSGAVLDRLFDLARDMSGLTDANIREKAENLGMTVNGDSPSD